MTKVSLVGLILGAVLLATPSFALEPLSQAGRCSKAAGGVFNPNTKRWETQTSEQKDKADACKAKYSQEQLRDTKKRIWMSSGDGAIVVVRTPKSFCACVAAKMRLGNDRVLSEDVCTRFFFSTPC